MLGLILNTVTITDTVTSSLLGNTLSKLGKSLFQLCLFLQVLPALPLSKTTNSVWSPWVPCCYLWSSLYFCWCKSHSATEGHCRRGMGMVTVSSTGCKVLIDNDNIFLETWHVNLLTADNTNFFEHISITLQVGRSLEVLPSLLSLTPLSGLHDLL